VDVDEASHVKLKALAAQERATLEAPGAEALGLLFATRGAA